MEIVKPENSMIKRRKPRSKVDRSAALLSLIVRVLKHKYTATRLSELIDGLPKRDQAMLICHYIKPPLPEKAKDPVDQLSPHMVEQMFDLIKKQINVG